MHMDGSLESFLLGHAQRHDGYFEKEVVESEFAHAVTVALGSGVVEELSGRTSGTSTGKDNGRKRVRRTAGCGSLINRVQKAYSCKTCAKDMSSVLCPSCFFATDHTGHDTSNFTITAFGTICDCGDPSAWNRELGCPDHPLAGATREAAGAENRREDSTDNSIKVLRILWQFIVTTMYHAHGPVGIPPPGTSAQLYDDAFGTAPGRPQENGDGKQGEPISLVLWADEKHTSREIARQVGIATGYEQTKVASLIEELENEGRVVIATTTDTDLLLHLGQTLGQMDLTISNSRAHRVYNESAMQHVLRFLLDLSDTSFLGDETYWRRLMGQVVFEKSAMKEKPDYPVDNLSDAGVITRIEWVMRCFPKLWRGVRVMIMRILSRLFAADRDFQMQLADKFAFNYPTLINQLIVRDREPEYALVLWGTHLFTRPDFALTAAWKQDILSVFARVLTSYFSDQKIAGQGLVIPPRPVNRISPESDGFKSKKWQVLFKHLKVTLRQAAVQQWLVNDPNSQMALIDFIWLWRGVSSFYRQVRDHVEYENDGWMRVLTVVVELASVTQAIGRSFQYGTLNNNLRILRTISARILEHHQLIEANVPGEAWVTSPARFGQHCRNILEITVGKTAASPFNPLHWLMAEVIRQTGALYTMAIDKGTWSALPQCDREMWIGRDDHGKRETESDDLLLMEKPLQTVVFMSQLRSNMWVRNGQNIRGLLIHYRETYLRDDGYDNDLLMLQHAMIKLDPEVFTITLLQRFGMLLESNAKEHIDANPGKWSLLDHVDRDQGLPTGAVIQLCTMLEELLGLMMVLLTETAGLNGLSDRTLIRRALTHLLCFAPLPWSEIVRAVPERMCENINFISVLREVAELHFPKGKTETGYYHLRTELYADIDPYFYHYTRNQQQQANEILQKKRSCRVIQPNPIRLPAAPHPFSGLHRILQSPFIIDLVYYSLWKAVELDSKQKTGEASDPQFIPTVDGMLELALQLFMVALVNAPEPSAAQAMTAQHSTLPTEQNLLGLLHTLKANKSKQAFWARLDLILEILDEHHPGARRMSALSANGIQTVSNALADEDRKAKNKKRQADIMAKFAKNQQTALDAFDDEEAEMDEDSFYGNCIVCQEECRATRPSGVLTFIQPSKTIRNLVVQKDWYEEILRTPTNLDQPVANERYGSGLTGEPVETDAYPTKHQRFGLHASSCGHMMHEACLQGFCKNTRARQLSQGQRNHPENSWRGEFLCPLCKSLCNMLLPLDSALLERPVPTAPVNMRPNLANAIRQVSDESLKHTDETRQAFRRQHADAGQVIPCFATSDRTPVKTPEGGEDLQLKSRYQMLRRFMDIVIPLSDQTAFMQKRLEDCGSYLPQDLLAYSIACVEIASRSHPSDSREEFTTEATERMIFGLTVLLREKMVQNGFPLGDETVGRIGIFTRLLPDWFRPRPLQVPLLARDPLTIVVEAAITCQHALSPIILLCYHIELCRAMLAITFWARLCACNTQSSAWAGKPPNDNDFATAQAIFPEARSLLLNFYRQTPQLYHEALSALTAIPEAHIAKFLYSFTLPFLRRCTILTQALKHVNPERDRPVAGPRHDEYTRYLNAFSILPPGRSLFQTSNAAAMAAKVNGTEQLSNIIGGWLKQWINNKQQLPVLEYPGIYDLYRLPASLTDVFRIGLNRKCRGCGTEPAHPALCLFCGKFLCLGTDCCAEGELGECNIHRMECGGAVGLFVDVKRWALLYLFAGSGTFGPMPYLDMHGEVDQGARRGHPQTQHRARMDELRKLWLTHQIPTFVARKMEATLDQGGWGST